MPLHVSLQFLRLGFGLLAKLLRAFTQKFDGEVVGAANIIEQELDELFNIALRDQSGGFGIAMPAGDA